MGYRRRRNDDTGDELAPRVAVFIVILAFYLLYRFGIAVLYLGIVGLIGAGVLLFVVMYFKSVAEKTVLPPTELKPIVRAPIRNSSSAPLPVPKASFTCHELAQNLRTIDWFQFEKIVAIAYRKSGYAVTRQGGANPDGGIDMVIEKDGIRSAVQCKQWKTWNIGVKPVREFLGALTDSGIKNGIFVSLCGYTEDARLLAQKHGITMVTKDGLAELLESTDARFDPEVLELLRDTRKFCPKCESEMVLRSATKGPNVGGRFWGCSRYPRCRCTIQIER